MSNDLERIITELEDVTARMSSVTCWEQSSGFRELSASRCALAACLMDRRDVDPSAAARISALIQAGTGLVARVVAMRESLLASIAETETGQCFTRELGSTVPSQAPRHCFDISA